MYATSGMNHKATRGNRYRFSHVMAGIGAGIPYAFDDRHEAICAVIVRSARAAIRKANTAAGRLTRTKKRLKKVGKALEKC